MQAAFFLWLILQVLVCIECIEEDYKKRGRNKVWRKEGRRIMCKTNVFHVANVELVDTHLDPAPSSLLLYLSLADINCSTFPWKYMCK